MTPLCEDTFRYRGPIIFPLYILFIFSVKEKKIYVIYKSLKTPAVACLENGDNFFMQNNILLKVDPNTRKLQEPENKQNKIKENSA